MTLTKKTKTKTETKKPRTPLDRLKTPSRAKTLKGACERFQAARHKAEAVVGGIIREAARRLADDVYECGIDCPSPAITPALKVYDAACKVEDKGVLLVRFPEMYGPQALDELVYAVNHVMAKKAA